MPDHSSNQTHSRKKQGSDQDQPSKAPGQDERARPFIGSPEPDRSRADGDTPQQGISNRPANDEHAFPDSDEPPTAVDVENVEPAIPAQQGGNRGSA